jgi:hypothetical protein
MLRPGHDVLDDNVRAPGRAWLFDPRRRADPQLQAGAVRLAASVAQHTRAIGAFSHFPFRFHSADRNASRSEREQGRGPISPTQTLGGV